ncbi:MAG: radical SAM protein [Desulfobulbaceae bacterium]|nr:radical SAM protein [Desulfobulbaceae bacterium]
MESFSIQLFPVIKIVTPVMSVSTITGKFMGCQTMKRKNYKQEKMSEQHPTHARIIHSHLPIFRYDGGRKSVIYTPGHLAVLPSAGVDIIEQVLLGGNQPINDNIQNFIEELIAVAQRNVQTWQKMSHQPFAPECLTLYLSNQCNLSCSYCWSDDVQPREITQQQLLSLDDVKSSAHIVVENCLNKGKPFTLVVQGGGEATLHWDLLQKIIVLTKRIAADKGVQWWGYLATNGMVAKEKIEWLSKQFNEICLSCDGPPAIQDAHRPFLSGLSSSGQLERTASIIADSQCKLSIRSTITPGTIKSQEEIVQYLYHRLRAKSIRFEPAYQVNSGKQPYFVPKDARCFVDNFLRAQKMAQKFCLDFSYSGVRMDVLHGGYCNFLRESLHLLPDGSVTPCSFALAGQKYTSNNLTTLSQAIEEEKLQALLIPPICTTCVNKYHCVRGCPEVCILQTSPGKIDVTGFRCEVNRLLTTAKFEAAIQASSHVNEPVKNSPQEHEGRGQKSQQPLKVSIDTLLQNMPGEIDREIISDNWSQVQSIFYQQYRGLPQPIWSKNGFTDDGSAAWKSIVQRLHSRAKGKKISLYCHVPFCRGRCHFCDCHSIPLPKKNRKKEELYLQKVLQEIDAWAEHKALCLEKVTTVHFGGGTPNCIETNTFERLVEAIGHTFYCTSETEWALETTTERLSNKDLQMLSVLGFRRLHVGVQTLEESLRTQLGRQSDKAEVISGIERALARGYIVSVDLIYGLPGQTLKGFIETLNTLVKSGVHGFSLYQLQESPRNKNFIKRYADRKRDIVFEYVLFQAADQLLRHHGFRKNHFAHYARGEDENLYYTHRSRDEDLIALGPTSDGILEGYSYKHQSITEYLREDKHIAACPWLEGGIQEEEVCLQTLNLKQNLMTGAIDIAAYKKSGLKTLVDTWSSQGMVLKKQEPNTHKYELSANGSWFISRLLQQVDEVTPDL